MVIFEDTGGHYLLKADLPSDIIFIHQVGVSDEILLIVRQHEKSYQKQKASSYQCVHIKN